MRRALLALVLAILLAGCSGFVDGSGSERALPPGVAPSGIQDPDALIEAHSERLDSVPYTVEDTFRSGPAGEKPGVRIHREIRFGGDPARYWTRSTTGFWGAGAGSIANRTVVGWSNGTAVAVNTTVGGDSTLEGTTDAVGLFYPEPTPATYREALYVLFATSNLSIDAATGEDEIMLVGTIPDRPGSVVQTIDATGEPEGATVGRSEVRLIVSEAGRIRWWQVSWDVVLEDGTRYRESRTVRIRDPGSTEIAKPDWVPRALTNGTAPTEVPGPVGG